VTTNFVGEGGCIDGARRIDSDDLAGQVERFMCAAFEPLWKQFYFLGVVMALMPRPVGVSRNEDLSTGCPAPAR